jgi:hypothetical protein
MMKIPIQVAPVQRGGSTARYAMSSGIKPSESLCSCGGAGWGCAIKWERCPEGYKAQCSWAGWNCNCWCCKGDDCMGPYG